VSTQTVVSCDNPTCKETRGDNHYGWISLTLGGNRLPSNDFCSWSCVAEYAATRWEPKTPKPARRKNDKPVTTISGAPYLRDAVQPPLPGVGE
jgi:hypothetical protein